MRSIFERIPEALARLRGATQLDIDIMRLKKAIQRSEDELDDMRLEWSEAGGGCCPSCWSGGRYSSMADKQDRQEAWLKVLEERRKRRR